MTEGTDRGGDGRLRGIVQSFGPGVLWAATAIGVSHLVQSTRAGAVYGFGLVGVVVVANLMKYPFFEYGPRYAAATGESLLEGYERLGRWVVIVYLALTVGTMFAVVGAIGFVTGSLATTVFGTALSPFGWTVLILVASGGVLAVGRYPLLDGLVKAVILLLTLSTVAAVLSALGVERAPAAEAAAPAVWSPASYAFLIALVGWMPSAIDISVWHSLWTLERAEQTRHRPTLGEALFDFNVGYLGTAAIALLFLSLGALVLHGRGVELAESGGAFAGQLIEAYAAALGGWARPIIAVAALTTMFSTTLTVVDAFPRVLQRATGIVAPRTAGREAVYWVWMAVVLAGALLLVLRFTGRLTGMVDFATTLSFLTSPVLAWFNFRLVTGRHMPPAARPAMWLQALSWAGLAFGVAFGVAFLVWRFG